MSFDPGGLRTSSPVSSGRASPIARFRAQAGEDGPNTKDKAYRRYALAVERALSSFDTAQQEWADYISFLSRLLKALQAHPPNSHAVPESQTVATRLAQCLKPSLPSGVHQKALEVYAFVFTTIGSSNLARDFHIYFPGLASVLSFASLSVRPLFLSLFEDHIVRLDAAATRPALKSMILCLLPGLEDETSEDFDRVLHVLDKLRGAPKADGEKRHEEDDSAVSAGPDSFFWQCFFLASITNPSRRQGALVYLVRHLPKFSTKRGLNNEEALKTLSHNAQEALSPEPGLLIRCFSSGLTDKQVLVQRGFLDLLVSHLPLDSAVLQHAVPPADLDRLIFAAVGVVSRRDMSLNRRLWTWFLGPEPKTDSEKAELAVDSGVVSPTVDLSQHHAAYFARYGLRALTRSVLALLEQDIKDAAERARPFRICLSLMDRWEVGGLLIPHIFIPALKNAFDYNLTASKRDGEEVLKSASNFFDGVESGLIWAKIVELANAALGAGGQSTSERLYNIQLCAFILQRFNLREEEMIFFHMPMTALFILVSLNQQARVHGDDETKILALELVEKLTTIIPQDAFAPGTKSNTQITKRHKDKTSLMMTIKTFYEQDQGTIENEVPPASSEEVGNHLLRESIGFFVRLVNNASISSQKTADWTALDLATKILCSLLRAISTAPVVLADTKLLHSLRELLNSKGSQATEFPVLQAIASTLSTIQGITTKTQIMSTAELLLFQDTLVQQLWSHLNPAVPKYQVEAVRVLWQLESISGATRSIEASITSLMTSRPSTKGGSPQTDPGRNFSVLWTHSIQERTGTGEKGQRGLPRRASSYAGAAGAYILPADPSVVLSRPLFVMLDWLEVSGSDQSAFVTSWLQQLPSLPKVFEILIDHIRDLKCIQQLAEKPKKADITRRSAVNDRQECLFYLRHVHRVIQAASEHTWIVLAGDMVQPLDHSAGEDADQVALQGLIIQICMRILAVAHYGEIEDTEADLERIALDIVRFIVEGPFSAPLKELELETDLLAMLNGNLAALPPQLQTAFLDTITSTVKLRSRKTPGASKTPHQRRFSRDIPSTPSQTSLAKDATAKEAIIPLQLPPPGLVDCIKSGFSSANSRLILDEWVAFLRNVLPLLSDTLFQHLIPLVEVFCSQIGVCFDGLRSTFTRSNVVTSSPEPTIISLLNGLEQILATAHDKLISDESKKPTAKSPEQPQGFFGNVTNMTQGLFAGEAEKQPTRTATANSRLAVLLCFQDTLRSCFRIWTWGVHGHQSADQDSSSAASFAYTSLRLRKRALKVLENLFAAEALECLEILATLFCHPTSDEYKPVYVLELLNVLNGSRPKYTAPAIFNAIYRRINADASRDNIQTSDLTAANLVGFLMEYVKSIEDDAMDEIWSDCVTFLKDILNNPLDYSQILPLLLSFVALIAEKVDNTNFGEQRKMRKELGDVFLRLLTATFTALGPAGFLQDSNQGTAAIKGRNVSNGTGASSKAQDFALTLASVVSKLPVILNDNERISVATSGVSMNVIGPAVRAKAFPKNIDQSFLELLSQLTKVAQGAKAWKKDVTDALNDAKFFGIPPDLAQNYMVPILRQLAVNDKERLPELLSRLTAPTTAGIVFGVGATSARMEADRKTQLNLRRIALLILASDEDAFVERYRTLEEKLTELLTATPTSSPSSITRAEVFMVLRALILRSSSVYLSAFWPLINSEVQSAILSLISESADADQQPQQYNNASVLQACKVLDLLVTLDLDDFQLHEWLFITDTIDAVYRPPGINNASTALADEIAEALGNDPATPSFSALEARASIQLAISPASASSSAKGRRSFLEPLLSGLEDVEASEVKLLPKRDLATRILQPFFGQLSIWTFEATYGILGADVEGCERALLEDIFEENE